MNPFGPPVARASALTRYPDCARRSAAGLWGQMIGRAGFALRDLPTSVAAAIGTAVHAGAALSLKEQAATGTPGPADDATDCALESLRSQQASGVRYDRLAPEGQTAEKQSVRLLRTYLAHTGALRPQLIERRLTADSGLGLVLSGQADQVCIEPGAIRDLKTGVRLGWHKPQVGAYSLLARAHGIDIRKAWIDFVQRVPMRDEQPPPECRPYSVADAESTALAILARMAADYRTWTDGNAQLRMLPGDPAAFPANPSSNLCSEKYCAAWGTDFCREGGTEG